MKPNTFRGIGTANATSAPRSSDEAPRSAHPIASSTSRYRPISGATSCSPSIETERNSSSGSPMLASTSGDLLPVDPRRERLLLQLLLHGRDLHARAPLGPDQRGRHQQPGHRVGVHHGLRHQVGAVLLVRVREHAVDHAFVDAGLAEPLGGEPGVVGRVVPGVVLVEVVEQAGQPPQVLVLLEAPRERAHHALDRDQVPHRGLLQALLAAERDGGLTIHQLRRLRRAASWILEHERHARQHDVRLEQEQALDEQRVLVVQQAAATTCHDRTRASPRSPRCPRLRGEPPDLLEHRAA